MLFESLCEKIMFLVDEVIVYLVYGVGLVCGKNLSIDIWGYFGDQKKINYVLCVDMMKEEFIEEVIVGLMFFL